MNIISFNTISSTLSQMSQEVVKPLSERHEKISVTVAAAIGLLVLCLGKLASNYWKARSLGQEAVKLYKEGRKLHKKHKVIDAKIKFDDAEKNFREALYYRPSHAFNLIHYGNVLRNHPTKNSKHESVDLYKKVLKSDPKNIDALRNLGKYYARSGSCVQAEEEFKRAKDAKLYGNTTLYTKKDASVLKNLAEVLHRQYKYEEATNNLKVALTICPGDSSILKVYEDILRLRLPKFAKTSFNPTTGAWTLEGNYISAEELELAAECYREYLKFAPDDFVSWAKYEIALGKLGKSQEADIAKKMGEEAKARVEKATTETLEAEKK